MTTASSFNINLGIVLLFFLVVNHFRGQNS
nr:MAG TPA: hypothetical protein [Caudoviricetes sp.]